MAVQLVARAQPMAVRIVTLDIRVERAMPMDAPTEALAMLMVVQTAARAQPMAVRGVTLDIRVERAMNMDARTGAPAMNTGAPIAEPAAPMVVHHVRDDDSLRCGLSRHGVSCWESCYFHFEVRWYLSDPLKE